MIGRGDLGSLAMTTNPGGIGLKTASHGTRAIPIPIGAPATSDALKANSSIPSSNVVKNYGLAVKSTPSEGSIILQPSPLEPIIMELKRKYGGGVTHGFGLTGHTSMSTSLSLVTLLGDIEGSDWSEDDRGPDLRGSSSSKVEASGVVSLSPDRVDPNLHIPASLQGDSLEVKSMAKEQKPKSMIVDMSSFSDPILREMHSSQTSRPRDRPSHAHNLIMTAPHLRRLSPDSLDMDGIVIGRGAAGPLSLLLNRPMFQNCFEIPASSSQATSGNGNTSIAPPPGLAAAVAVASSMAGKKMKKRPTQGEEELASFLAQQRDRQLAQELSAFVGGLAHEMNLDEFAVVESEVFTSIFGLLNSKTDHANRLAGVIAIDALVDVSSADEEKKAIKFANSLSSALRASGDYDFLAGVARALGRMAMGSANVDYVEFEVTRSLEWLRVERSDRRLAAALTLKELAQNSPTTFYSKTNQSLHSAGSNEFIENIFPVLRDPQPIVRACAADALSECLQFLIKRQHRSTTGYLCEIYNGMMEGLAADSAASTSSVRSSGKISSAPNEDAALHGSLLVLTELLCHTGNFMVPRFEETCQAVFSLIEDSKALIRLEVLRLCPILARTCPGTFGRKFLGTALDFIIQSASTTPPPKSTIDLRPCAFISLGQLSLAVAQSESTPVMEVNTNPLKSDNSLCLRLSDVFSLLRGGLTSTSASASTNEVNITRATLHCAANVVHAVGELSYPHVNDLLDGMFNSGLSEDLIDSAQAIALSLPSQQHAIEERLLQELSIYLAGTPLSFAAGTTAPLLREELEGNDRFNDPRARCGGPRSKNHDSSELETIMPEFRLRNNNDQIRIKMSGDQLVVTKLVLSLRTLGSFARSRGQASPRSYQSLLPFVKNVVAKYLAHPAVEVRKEAALCCCQLLLPPISCKKRDVHDGYISECRAPTFGALANSIGVHHIFVAQNIGSTSGRVVEDVLHTLITAVVSDPSPMVRLCIIRSLDRRYDIFLAQAHHLQPLFLLLRDETLLVRAAGLSLLGRLALHNPAPILPQLRKFLMELLTELRCGGDMSSGKEAATRLLIVFLKCEALHRVVPPFLPALIKSLSLDGVAPRIASASLEALGELSCVVRNDMCPYIAFLFPHLLTTMQDFSSATKQKTSFRALGQLAASTGYVILPYLDYPQLLPQAAAVLPGTKRAPWSLRREVIRTFGLLGAIDPRKYSTVSSKSRKRGGWGGGYFVDDHAHHQGSTAIKIAGGESSVDTDADTYGFKYSAQRDDDDDNPAHFYMYEQYTMTAQPISELSPPERLSPANEDFYSTVAVQALTRILKDQTQAVHHGMAMQAIMFTFNALGLKCVPFLKGIVPYILQTCRSCNQEKLRESLLQQIAKLVIIVKDHLRPYLSSIFLVIEEFWFTQHLPTILALVEKMAETVPEHFVEYVPRLVPLLLKILDAPRVSDWVMPTMASNASYTIEAVQLELVLRSIRSMRRILADYLHLLIPALVKLVESLITNNTPIKSSIGLYAGEWDTKITSICIVTIETLSSAITSASETAVDRGFDTTIFNAHTHQVVTARAAQPLIRLLGREPHPCKLVGIVLVEAICVCAQQLGRDQWMCYYHTAARNAILSWQTWICLGTSGPPRIGTDVDDGWTVQNGIVVYDQTTRSLMQRCRVEGSTSFSPVFDEGIDEEGAMLSTDNEIQDFDNGSDLGDGSQNSLSPHITQVFQTSTFRVNLNNLQRAWDVSQRTTREDWDEWMRRFAVQLLREAPNPALRASAGLAHAYPPLARELFSAAFLCCWLELNEQYQQNLIQSMEIAFVSDVSPETLQTLLNLAEFMERDGVDGGLPIKIPVLAQLALKCRAYAKALHYKEREHKGGSSGSCVEELISINKKLDLPEAALGILKATQNELEHCRIAHTWGVHPSLFGAKHYGYSPEIRQNYQHQIHMGNASIYDENWSIWAGVEVQESWLAKLGSWSEALTMYERKLREQPDDVSAILGCMHCLDARGDWKRVLNLANKSLNAISGDIVEDTLGRGDKRGALIAGKARDHRKAMKYCAQAAWRLGQWDELEKFASQLVRGSPGVMSGASRNSRVSTDGDIKVDFDGAFYSAVLHIHRKEWSIAEDAIDAARRSMEGRFTALMSESYKRAYPSMVTAQTLAEMEEIIAYMKLEDRAASDVHRHEANKQDPKDSRKRLLEVWRKRLAGCRVDAEVHSSIVAVRSLVLGPIDDVESIVTLSSLSRQAHCYKLAERVLCKPLLQLGADLNGSVFGFGLPENLSIRAAVNSTSTDILVTQSVESVSSQFNAENERYSHRLVRDAGGAERISVQHQLYFAYLRHLWATGNRDEALTRLERLSAVVDLVSSCENIPDSSLQVSCWLKLGDWKVENTSPSGVPSCSGLQTEVLYSYKKATAAKGNDYKAWHAWALMNFRLAQQLQERSGLIRESVLVSAKSEFSRHQTASNMRYTNNHVVAAVQGFVKAISFGTKRWSASVQQDMLNFLTCFFKYGELPDVCRAINEGLESVTLECWLGVLPQLLARIHIQSPSIRSSLHNLLTRLGAKHPQALMYPLSVLLKSPVVERKQAAENLMNTLKAHSNDLVEQSLMVSSELIRVAILWLEMWHEGLEDASRLYYGEGNVQGMLDVLLPLHEQLERGPSTRREHDFIRSFGRDLSEAHSLLREYIRLTTNSRGSIPTQGGFNDGLNSEGQGSSRNAEAEFALREVWDLYYTVFRRINKQLPGLVRLELANCSPALLRAHNLELGVPGSYRVDGSYVKIERFRPSVQVITSKQRPRKVTLQGSNGKEYMFLLKGHEDLRQDERVMQLFGLVNALLAKDRRTNKHDLNIQRYAITPLSHDAGLVGWVPHCETLHSLIRDYRESRKILLNTENREMLKMAPDYDLLTVMQKVEVFDTALQRTVGKGNDLYEVLWIKSSDSEEWLEHRTKYTRSLAVMSMVGYILGLGDRHPSNLMLDEISGRVLHIDFGDCFEVAMHREKYPETIPFRLTRMLINGMEVSKIEGSYRSTCERTMGVLRDNRDSLIAMLEAFVYDPLISWRLLGQASQNATEEQSNDRGTASANRPDSRVLRADSRVDLSHGGRRARIGPDNAGQQFQVPQPITEGTREEGELEDEGTETTLLNHGPPSLTSKGMQMYSHIQSMAANLSSSSRIASLTVGDASRAAAEGSLAQSRIDRSVRHREVLSMLGEEGGTLNEEALNERALKVIRRVQDKLAGTDFGNNCVGDIPLDVPDQVQRLIVQATSSESLCQLFIGWCAFW